MHNLKLLCSLGRFLFLVAAAVCVYRTGTAQAAESSSSCQTRGPEQINKPITKVPNDSKPLSVNVHYIYRTGGKGEPKQLEDGSVLQSGDHYKIQFTPQEDSYVYIFQIDSSNTVYQLFPMEEWNKLILKNRNPVKAYEPYTLPAEDKSFVLDEQHGAEAIYFVATHEDDPNIAKLAEQLRDARKQGNKVRDQRIQKDLTKELRTRGPAKIVPDPGTKAEVPWNQQETFKLSGQRLDNLCPLCTNTINFKHQ